MERQHYHVSFRKSLLQTFLPLVIPNTYYFLQLSHHQSQVHSNATYIETSFQHRKHAGISFITIRWTLKLMKDTNKLLQFLSMLKIKKNSNLWTTDLFIKKNSTKKWKINSEKTNNPKIKTKIRNFPLFPIINHWTSNKINLSKGVKNIHFKIFLYLDQILAENLLWIKKLETSHPLCFYWISKGKMCKKKTKNRNYKLQEEVHFVWIWDQLRIQEKCQLILSSK